MEPWAISVDLITSIAAYYILHRQKGVKVVEKEVEIDKDDEGNSTTDIVNKSSHIIISMMFYFYYVHFLYCLNSIYCYFRVCTN